MRERRTGESLPFSQTLLLRPIPPDTTETSEVPNCRNASPSSSDEQRPCIPTGHPEDFGEQFERSDLHQSSRCPAMLSFPLPFRVWQSESFVTLTHPPHPFFFISRHLQGLFHTRHVNMNRVTPLKGFAGFGIPRLPSGSY